MNGTRQLGEYTTRLRDLIGQFIDVLRAMYYEINSSAAVGECEYRARIMVCTRSVAAPVPDSHRGHRWSSGYQSCVRCTGSTVYSSNNEESFYNLQGLNPSDMRNPSAAVHIMIMAWVCGHWSLVGVMMSCLVLSDTSQVSPPLFAVGVPLLDARLPHNRIIVSLQSTLLTEAHWQLVLTPMSSGLIGTGHSVRCPMHARSFLISYTSSVFKISTTYVPLIYHFS